MLRTLLSCAVMLSRRAVAAASSRSESRRMRSACSLADETRAAASDRAASSSAGRLGGLGPAVLLGLAGEQVGALLDGGEGLVLRAPSAR